MKSNFEKVQKNDFINYNLQGFQGLINKTEYVIEKTETHITLLCNNHKAHFSKDYFNSQLLNVTIVDTD